MGVPDPEEMWVKSGLAILISRTIEDRKLSRKTASRLLEIDKKALALLQRGRLRNFSVYQLMEYVLRLGHDVEIVIQPNSHHKKKKPVRINLAKAFEYSIETSRIDLSNIA